MAKYAFAATILGAAMLSGGTAEAATLNGTTLSAEYLYPDSSTVYPSATTTGPFTVGAGTDAVISVEGVTDILLDFAGNGLTVTFNTTLSSPAWVNTSFNGLRIMLESAGSLTSFALASATIGPITTSFDADELFINWAGASYGSGSTATFDIGYEIAPVPLPAGLSLLAAGLGSLIGLRRKKAQDSR